MQIEQSLVNIDDLIAKKLTTMVTAYVSINGRIYGYIAAIWIIGDAQ